MKNAFGLIQAVTVAAIALMAGALQAALEVVPQRAILITTVPQAGQPLAQQDAMPGLVRVEVPRSFCAAVSDQFNILVVGSQALKASEGKELYVFKLGPNGEPTGAPEIVSTPKIAEVGEFPNQVLSIKFHPKLPLMYVWQDTDDKKTKRADAVNEKYPHLIIYSVDPSGKLTLAAQGAIGTQFDINNIWGDMAFSPQGDKLYVPNLRTPAKSSFSAAGYIGLDPKTGMIATEDTEQKDPITKATVVVKKEIVKYWPLHQYGADSLPTGNGYVVGSEGAFITNANAAFGGFDPNNRQGWMILYYPPFTGANLRLSAHPNPKNWRFYATALGYGYFYSMAHADGYTTGVPQMLSVAGLTIYSECVLMTKRNQLVAGGANQICVVTLTPEGLLTKDVFVAKANNPTVRAIAYSERADKLFIAETPKPPEKPAK